MNRPLGALRPLAGPGAYTIAEAFNWPGSLEDKPESARRFHAVVPVAMIVTALL